MDLSLQSLIRPLLRYWYIVLGLAVLTAVLAGIDRTPVYESKARLLYKIGVDYLDTDSSGRVAGRIELAEAVNSEVQIMTSQDQLLKVVERVGIDNLVSGAAPGSTDMVLMDEAVTNLRKGLNAKSVENSAVVYVTYEHAEPRLAQSILGAVIDVYREEREKVLTDYSFGTLRVEFDEAQQRYAQARNELDEFLASNDQQDVSAQLERIRRQMDEISRNKFQTQTNLIENERKAEILLSEIAKQPAFKSVYTETGKSSTLSEAESRLSQLQLEEQLLLSSYTEGSRAVQNIRDQIRQVEAVINSQTGNRSVGLTRQGSNPVREGLESSLTQLKVQIAGDRVGLQSLAEQEGALRTKIREFEALNATNSTLVDNLELARSRFRDIESRYLASKVLNDSASMRQANVRLIESPTLPLRKVGMTRVNRIIRGAIVGGLLGWILAFWIDQLRQPKRSRRNTDDPFAQTNQVLDDIPVLGEFRRAEI